MSATAAVATVAFVPMAESDLGWVAEQDGATRPVVDRDDPAAIYLWNMTGLYGVAQRANGERFGQTWDAFEQDVPTGQDADENPFEHVGLSNDNLPDFTCEVVDEGAFFRDEFVEGADVVHGRIDQVG